MKAVIPFGILIALYLGVGVQTTEAQQSVPEVPSPLDLGQALRYALRHNPELSVSAAFVGLSEADSIGAQMRPYNPEVEVSLAGGGENLFSTEERGIEVSLEQVFEIGGKRGLRREIASERVRAARANLTARQQQVIGAVRRVFRRALLLEKRYEVFSRLADMDEELARAVEARVRDGLESPLSARLTRLDFLKTWTLAIQARAQNRVAMADLMRGLGAASEQEPTLVGPLEPDSLGIPESEAVAIALERRADRRVLLADIRAAQASIRLADKMVLPDPRLGISVGSERSVFEVANFAGGTGAGGMPSEIIDSDRRLELRLSVPIPLLQRNQGGKALARSEVRLANAQLARFDATTSARIRASHRDVVEKGIIYRGLLRGTTHVEDDLVRLRTAYQDGRISVEVYLTDRARLTDSLVQTFDAGESFWDARSHLEELLATDFEETASLEDRP